MKEIKEKKSEAKRIMAPFTEEAVKDLKAGERVLLSGEILIARDAAHKRMSEAVQSGEGLPFDPKGAAIFYAGPAPAAEGEIIGPIGPTTSGRMDPYTPLMLSLGVKAMIGKGKRSAEVHDAMKRYGAVYLGATGGTSVLIAEKVKAVEGLAYEDLGPEAVKKLTVEDLPLVVLADSDGGDLFKSGQAEAAELIKKLKQQR